MKMCDDVFDDEDAGNLMDIKVKEFERINSGIEQVTDLILIHCPVS